MLKTTSAQAIAPRFRRTRGLAVASDSERLVLDLVRKSGVLSRADLTRACGFSGPGAKGLIDELVERGLLQLGLPASKGRGQPSATVSLVASYAYCLGLAISVDGFSLTLMDFAGQTLGEKIERQFPLQLSFVAETTKTAMNSLLKACHVDPLSVFGIGLSMTGPFVGDGILVNPPLSMPDAWHQVSLEPYFSAQLGYPVWQDNDANCAAIAECVLGTGRTLDSFVYLYFTDGFGSGVIEQGKLLRGSHGNAGELGRLFALTGMQRPTLEDLRLLLAHSGHNFPDLQAMLNHYTPEWPEIDLWIASVSTGMTTIVAAITGLLDPQAIVFGARLPLDLAQRLAASVRFESHPRRDLYAPNPQLMTSKLAINSAGLGAALLPFQEHFFL